ncbi:MAG: hypothetical protein C4297_05415 [Gemmataceae bacterium]
MRRMTIVAVLVVGPAIWCAAAPEQKPARVGPDPELWKQTVHKALRFLQNNQAEDGSFSKERSLGVTGIVVAGALKTGLASVDDAWIARSLKFIESLVNEKEGHIAGIKPRDQLKNYVTAVNVMALVEANRDGRYERIVSMAAHYLKELQWDEGEGKAPQDDFYGGAGYDSKSRPDLSNTQFFVDALVAAGVKEDDPHLKKALVFISRCQNLKSEYNDQPWAGKINDGSFIYSAAGGGETKADVLPDGGLTGYGSMTYAGVKSMIYAGVDKNDKRVQAALAWLRKHYTVDENPGMPKARNQQGLYYYYHTMAKCLHLLGEDYFVDDRGVRHDWRADLTLALAKRQRPDGSWVNLNDRWMEGDPNLVTGYALLTLAYCKPPRSN